MPQQRRLGDADRRSPPPPSSPPDPQRRRSGPAPLAVASAIDSRRRPRQVVGQVQVRGVRREVLLGRPVRGVAVLTDRGAHRSSAGAVRPGTRHRRSGRRTPPPARSGAEESGDRVATWTASWVSSTLRPSRLSCPGCGVHHHVDRRGARVRPIGQAAAATAAYDPARTPRIRSNTARLCGTSTTSSLRADSPRRTDAPATACRTALAWLSPRLGVVGGGEHQDASSRSSRTGCCSQIGPVRRRRTAAVAGQPGRRRRRPRSVRRGRSARCRPSRAAVSPGRDQATVTRWIQASPPRAVGRARRRRRIARLHRPGHLRPGDPLRGSPPRRRRAQRTPGPGPTRRSAASPVVTATGGRDEVVDDPAGRDALGRVSGVAPGPGTGVPCNRRQQARQQKAATGQHDTESGVLRHRSAADALSPVGGHPRTASSRARRTRPTCRGGARGRSGRCRHTARRG